MAYTTIDDPSEYHQSDLYTGNGSSQSLTFDGNSDLQPDWIWGTLRDENGGARFVFDSTRGATKRIKTDTNTEEQTRSGVTSFDSDGYTVGSHADSNLNNELAVVWGWKANGGSLTNVSESGNNPAHSRQTSTTAGFSIIKYTGTGAVGTIAHGLGIEPDFIIFKRLETADNWRTYDSFGGGGKSMRLNLNGGHGTSSSFFNDTDATSSVFTVGTNSEINGDAETYIAYVFGSIQGYSKIGNYTGNGSSSDGPFVYTGFKPAWLMTKKTSASDHWKIYDNRRDPFNIGSLKGLKANDTDTESDAGTRGIDLLSNGFKIREGDGDTNGTGQTFFYMAFAEHPFVSSGGVPVTAR